MIILFILLIIMVCCFLNEYELRKYEKVTDKKIRKLIKKINTLEKNSNVCFSYINDIYEELERFDNYEIEKKC